MSAATHHDLLVLIAVFGALQITVLIALGISHARKLAALRRDAIECQRLIRMVAGLVAQETTKLRSAIRERP
jgi:hypothetical protein